eukprot:scaffold207906_cov21-Tisochrysis_lutea.AAC.1
MGALAVPVSQDSEVDILLSQTTEASSTYNYEFSGFDKLALTNVQMSLHAPAECSFQSAADAWVAFVLLCWSFISMPLLIPSSSLPMPPLFLTQLPCFLFSLKQLPNAPLFAGLPTVAACLAPLYVTPHLSVHYLFPGLPTVAAWLAPPVGAPHLSVRRLLRDPKAALEEQL